MRHYTIMMSCQPGEAGVPAPFPRGRNGGGMVSLKLFFWLSWDSRPGFLVLRPGRSAGEEALYGCFGNIGSDLDWTHFYEGET